MNEIRYSGDSDLKKYALQVYALLRERNHLSESITSIRGELEEPSSRLFASFEFIEWTPQAGEYIFCHAQIDRDGHMYVVYSPTESSYVTDIDFEAKYYSVRKFQLKDQPLNMDWQMRNYLQKKGFRNSLVEAICNSYDPYKEISSIMAYRTKYGAYPSGLGDQKPLTLWGLFTTWLGSHCQGVKFVVVAYEKTIFTWG